MAGDPSFLEDSNSYKDAGIKKEVGSSIQRFRKPL